MIDPLTVACPKPGCGAKRGQRCVRLSGYGVGGFLRKQHKERFRAAEEAHRRRTRPRWRRLED